MSSCPLDDPSMVRKRKKMGVKQQKKEIQGSSVDCALLCQQEVSTTAVNVAPYLIYISNIDR